MESTMPKRDDITKTELSALYLKDGLTQKQIAELHHSTPKTIRRLLRLLGIPIRQQKRIEEQRPCANCGQLTTNPKFCTNSCAAKYNNQHFPKSKKQVMQWICVECGVPTTERRKYCDSCMPSQMNWMDKSIADLSRDGHYQVYRVVRNLARKIYKDSGRPMECVVCKYAEYVEICHIRPISSFDKRTLIREVNRLANLVALCPNHHWELDNGRLNLHD